MARKKTWREKLDDDHGLPRVVEIDERMSSRWGEGTFVIPAPREVDELMHAIPEGKLTTINHLREILAARHGATIACPITTGIFARVAAEAAAEDEADGEVDITPYWRTLKTGGELNPKYPGGVEGQRERLDAEGHTVVERGKRSFVADYEKRLADLASASAR
ncbi:MAG: MGMT family protein [Candidatus Bipolaricaulota bacterium]|nr:MGMT family protein [Candidatus Bipolaricaulota bacterium]